MSRLEELWHESKKGRCIILGNGPSLKEVDWELVKRTGWPIFGTNGIYDNPWGMVPDYYVCVNPLVLEQMADGIRELDTIKLLPKQHKALWEGEHKGEVVEIDTSNREPGFYGMLNDEPIWEGHTVTYVCMQLAYKLGFEEPVLLGLDHYYNISGVAPNQEVKSDGPDVNHFREDYFGKGFRWHTPDLERSELAYAMANAEFLKRDVHGIINCSARTACEVFEIAPLRHVASSGPPMVSAIVSAYYAEDIIRECIKDLMRQTMALEIVVVGEKGSKEIKVAKEIWASGAAWIKIVETDGVPTVYEAWAMGCKAASGKYLTNANTDDRHHPRAYEIMAEVLEGRPDVDLVYHDSYITWEKNQSFEQFLEENEGKGLAAGRQEGRPGIFMWPPYSKAGIRLGCFFGPQPMWRASVHQRIGNFDGSYKSAGDYEMWLRMAMAGMKAFHIAMPMGLYHANPEGVELRDPELSAYESRRALAQNQDEQTYRMDPFDEHTLVARVGDGMTLVDKDAFLGMAGDVEEMYDRLALQKQMAESKDA